MSPHVARTYTSECYARGREAEGWDARRVLVLDFLGGLGSGFEGSVRSEEVKERWS